MTELINQLVEEIKDVKIEPKYVVVRIYNDKIDNMKKVFSGNDKEILKNRMLEHIIKEFSLENYLSVEKLKIYGSVSKNGHEGHFRLFRKSDSMLETIYFDNEQLFDNCFSINMFKKAVVIFSRCCKTHYSIIDELKT